MSQTESVQGQSEAFALDDILNEYRKDAEPADKADYQIPPQQPAPKRSSLPTEEEVRAYLASYARGEARANSDIDFRVEKGKLTDLLQLGGLYCDLEEKLGKPLDLLTTQMLSPDFLRSIQPEEVLLYDGNA